MSITTQTLPKHYLRLIRLWPADPLRSVLVQDTLRRRITQRLLPTLQQPAANSDPKLSPPPPPVQASWIQAKADDAKVVGTNGAGVEGRRAEPWSEEKEMRQVKALYSLLENRYSRKYPISDEFLRPESKPNYYEELAAEMEAAPKRTWFQRKLLRLTQLIRFT